VAPPRLVVEELIELAPAESRPRGGGRPRMRLVYGPTNQTVKFVIGEAFASGVPCVQETLFALDQFVNGMVRGQFHGCPSPDSGFVLRSEMLQLSAEAHLTIMRQKTSWGVAWRYLSHRGGLQWLSQCVEGPPFVFETYWARVSV
jgi:hypothetical protein